MAVYAKHSVSAPPTAPEREKTRHLLLRGYCVLLVFIALTASGWNNVLGPAGLAVLIAATGVVSIVLWSLPARLRGGDPQTPRLAWRRLPWFALGYVVWAAVSVTWSHWPDATLLTWMALAVTTLQGLFVASMLTWREVVRAIASALKWVVGLSLLFELWVALILRHPILPLFVDPPATIPPELYWSRGNLFDGGRIQGIVGNANLLGMAALLAIVVFGIRMASGPRRGWLVGWIVVSAFLVYRAGSATVYLAAVAAAVVLATMLLMRTATRPGARTKWYVIYAAIAVGGGLAFWFGRDTVFRLLGRSSDLTGRQMIWDAVLERAWQQPAIGWGFSTPWLPWEAQIDGWIVDHDLTVFFAHNMWIDAFFQVGFVGVVLLGVMYLSLIWRAWFFAIDRPRWDLDARRPYAALTLLPTLVMTLLLVQGLTESRPLMEWGWMLVVLFSLKIKQSPIVGVGPAEQSLALERGDGPKRAT